MSVLFHQWFGKGAIDGLGVALDVHYKIPWEPWEEWPREESIRGGRGSALGSSQGRHEEFTGREFCVFGMACKKCERLWQGYADAISRYVDLVNQQEISLKAGDSKKLSELEAEVLAAAICLLGARDQAHTHAEMSHFHSKALIPTPH